MTSSIRREGDDAAAEDIHQWLTATRHGDIDSNCDVAGRDVWSRQSVSDSDISVCDKCIRYIFLCDVVQCCNDICFGATHTIPSKRHIDRQESGKASLTSHAFISVSFIISNLILFSTLVRLLISCSSSTLLMPVRWGAYSVTSITIACLIAAICNIASAVCFIDRRCFTQLSEGLVEFVRLDTLSTLAEISSIPSCSTIAICYIVTAAGLLKGLIVMCFIALCIKGLVWLIRFVMLSMMAEKTPFLYFWRVCQERHTKRSASDLLCNLQGFDCKIQSMIRLVASQSDIWRTEHFQASCTVSPENFEIWIIYCSRLYTARTQRTDIRCRYVNLAS